MDVLSAQSSVAGYRAVIGAANVIAKFFPMLMTPAIPPLGKYFTAWPVALFCWAFCWWRQRQR